MDSHFARSIPGERSEMRSQLYLREYRLSSIQFIASNFLFWPTAGLMGDPLALALHHRVVGIALHPRIRAGR
ncbi:MAG TPA: hypothetical protein VHN17_06585 [Steroidobacteraceae bacterium]|jgi:hypothetical protein|nr:hypothetical protein [Steroidobacteraceae bacterium]